MIQAEDMYRRTSAHATHRAEYCLPIDDKEAYLQGLSRDIWSFYRPLDLSSQSACAPPGRFVLLGAGSRTWALEASRLCPQRSIIGVDLSSPTADIQHPPSCSLRYEDDFPPWDGPTAYIRLRDSYFSLRNPRATMGNVFSALCVEGFFENEELRVEHWISNKPRFNIWRQRAVESARGLGIALHTAEDLCMATDEAGFRGVAQRAKKLRVRPSAMSGEIKPEVTLFEFVKQTVIATGRLLESQSFDAHNFVCEVVEEMEQDDCEISLELEMEILTAQK